MFELYDLRNNFSYYYDFYISAKEKSLSDAGKKNNISQSSLSRSISKLEEVLDLKLVKTTNKGFELTLDGERIYNKLDQLFNTIDVFTAKELSTKLDEMKKLNNKQDLTDIDVSALLSEIGRDIL